MKKMKVKKSIAIILILSLVLMVFAGCGNGDDKSGSELQQYTMGTMTATGGYMMLGTAIASIVNDNLDNINITPVQSPKGSVENVQTVQTGERELGLASSNVCLDGLETRTPDFTEPTTNVMGWFCAHYGITYSIVLESSGIKSWADMEGKKIAIGSPGSNDAYLAENIFFPMNNVDPKKVNIEYLSLSEAMTQMKDGHIDGYIGTGAPKVASIVDMTNSRETRFIPMEQAAIDKILEVYPEFIIKPMVQEDMPAMLMDAAEYPTVAMKHVAIINKDIDEDTVYEMTKAVFENLDQIYAVKEEFKVITLEDALNGMPIDVHPGAMKYFKEQGIGL